MRSLFRLVVLVACHGIFLAATATACSLCPLSSKPLSQELPQYPLVVFGPVVDASLAADGATGSCTVRVDKVFRDTSGTLNGKKTIVINRYTPPNPSVRYLLFFQFFDGRPDVLRAWDLSSDRLVKYLEGAPLVDKNDESARLARLRYFFNFLMDEEPRIALDAYYEWSNSTDREVMLVASTLDANNLRTWLGGAKTPAHCLSLFGYLLGASGTDTDAALLKRMILNPDSRMANALDGLLAGYIQKRPEDGWKLAQEILGDAKRPFTQRLTIHRMLLFFYNAKPKEVRSHILDCAAIMLRQSDTLDIITEQLRKWQIWDFTDLILQKYRSGEASSPITRKKIIRYALSSPQPQAKAFLHEIDTETVRELQRDLEFENPPTETNRK